MHVWGNKSTSSSLLCFLIGTWVGGGSGGDSIVCHIRQGDGKVEGLQSTYVIILPTGEYV